MITAINTLDDSTFEDNLTTSHQVDYVYTTLIPPETFENNEEQLVGNKADSITSLV